jgi:hypothetical protein
MRRPDAKEERLALRSLKISFSKYPFETTLDFAGGLVLSWVPADGGAPETVPVCGFPEGTGLVVHRKKTVSTVNIGRPHSIPVPGDARELTAKGYLVELDGPRKRELGHAIRDLFEPDSFLAGLRALIREAREASGAEDTTAVEEIISAAETAVSSVGSIDALPDKYKYILDGVSQGLKLVQKLLKRRGGEIITFEDDLDHLPGTNYLAFKDHIAGDHTRVGRVWGHFSSSE